RRAIGCFGGSFLVLFGARMAGGCTSGHMLSGGIQLALSGWLFTAATVTAMVATARLVYRDASWLTAPAGSGTQPERRREATGVSARVLVGVVLTGFAVMTALGADLTRGRNEGLLAPSDVLIPAVIPVLLVVAITITCRGGPTTRWHGAKKGRR
ncbi:YeeE/YedE thiosulfate transporter family protein, partial [Mycobacterium sp. THU-M116]